MLLSEVDLHIEDWPIGQKRTYKYRMNLTVPHFITLIRESKSLFKSVEGKDYSTYLFKGPLNREELFKELGSERLIYISEWNGWFDPVRLRTGGCECGSYQYGLDYPHSRWCFLFKGDR